MQNPELRNKFHVIFYEDMLLYPKETLHELSIGRIEEKFFKISSKTTNINQNSVNSNIQLAKWQVLFSSSQLERFQEILNHFGVNYYSAMSPLPISINDHSDEE